VRGDHVYVDRGLYTHHGIEVGQGEVIHYDGEPGSTTPGRVVASTLEEFLAGGIRRVRRYKRALPQKESARIALSRLGDQNYNLVFNNCEHFASWCRTGVGRSRQVEKAVRAVRRVLGL
jgi:hypothetical protein